MTEGGMPSMPSMSGIFPSMGKKKNSSNSDASGTDVEIKEISVDSDPLDILIHANEQLGKFLDSMKENKQIDNLEQFNLQFSDDSLTIDKIDEDKKLEKEGKINILNKTYSEKLKTYLKNDNILTQYKELLIKLIPTPKHNIVYKNAM